MIEFKVFGTCRKTQKDRLSVPGCHFELASIPSLLFNRTHVSVSSGPAPSGTGAANVLDAQCATGFTSSSRISCSGRFAAHSDVFAAGELPEEIRFLRRIRESGTGTHVRDDVRTKVGESASSGFRRTQPIRALSSDATDIVLLSRSHGLPAGTVLIRTIPCTQPSSVRSPESWV